MNYFDKVVGVTFGDRQRTIRKLSKGDQLVLIAEPNNAFDNHAVRVETSNGQMVGYISKDRNTNIFNNLIKNRNYYNVKVAMVTGGDLNNYGLNIEIHFEG